jgi:4-hydroxybenzoate polyprenyltransferase
MGLTHPVMLKNLLSLTRAGNLAIICLIFLIVRHTIINPFLGDDASSLNDHQFLLLLLSTVLTAAGGYIINDIFDTGPDEFNRPGTNKVGNGITVFTARILYASLTLGGLISAVIFGESTGVKYTVLVIGLCAGLLYFYSSSYKSMLLIGNLVISLLAGFSVLMTILFDKKAMMNDSVVTVVSAYSIFAFLITFNREIIKDCEDMEGDVRYGASTLPALFGTGTAKWVASLVAVTVLCGIGYIQIIQQQWQSPVPFAYVICFVQLPLIWLAISSVRAQTKSDFRRASSYSKLIMLTGILSMIVFHFSL